MTDPEGTGHGAFQESVGTKAALILAALKQHPEAAPVPVHVQEALAGLVNRSIELDAQVREQQAELDQKEAELAKKDAELAAKEIELRKREEESLSNTKTGLPNMRALKQNRLWSVHNGVVPEEGDFKRAEDQRRPWGWACLGIDLDEFKPINDTYGHKQGDRVLNYVAQALLGIIRGTDELYHPSGDEFIIFSQIPNKKAAIDMLASIRQRFLNQIAAIREGKLSDQLPPDLAVISDIDYASLERVDATFGMTTCEGPYVDRVAMADVADRLMCAQKEANGRRR